MSDDKTKVGGQDRSRVAISQPYEVEDFHQKHKHLSHGQAVEIIKQTKGDREKADALARSTKSGR